MTRTGRSVRASIVQGASDPPARSGPAVDPVRGLHGASWAEPPAECPWRGQWLNPPQGRTDDISRYGSDGSVLVHPHVFRSALLADPAVLSYQIQQTVTGGSRVVPAANRAIDLDALHRRVSEGLSRAGLPSRPSIEIVSDIKHHAQSGKLRRFVPLTTHVRLDVTQNHGR